MAIRKIRAGRVDFPANLYVGEVGTLFYDELVGGFRVSNGHTPGGRIVSPDIVNGTGNIAVNNAEIKGNITVDGNLIVAGNTTIVNNSVINNIQTVTGTLTVTGLSSIDGEMEVSGDSFFTGNSTFIGVTTFSGPFTQTGNLTITGNITSTGHRTDIVADLNDHQGAVEITGNPDGDYQTPYNTGVMLQLTGQLGAPTRYYIDGQSNYPVIAGRRYNGDTDNPTGLNKDDLFFRVAATPFTAEGWPTTTNQSSPRMDFITSEVQHLTGQGSRIEFWTCPIGGNVVTKVMTLDSGNGVVATSFVGPVTGNLTGTILTASQPNITTIGTLGSLTVTGLTSTGSLSATTATISGGTVNSTSVGATTPSTGAFTTLSASGGITGTLLTAAQTNITSVGTLGSLAVTGAITGASLNGAAIGGITPSSGAFTTLSASGGITGTLQTAAQPNITQIGTLPSLVVTGNVTASNFFGNVIGTSLTGTLLTVAQPNITSVGTLTSLIITGTLSAGATTASSLTTANAIITGGSLNNIPIGQSTRAAGSFTSVVATGDVSGATLTGTLQTAAQPNVTSLGTLSSLSISGGLTAGSMNSTPIGGTTPSSGAFTTLSASGGITGTLQTAAQPNVTSVGTLSSLTVSGALNATLSTAAQPNITSVGTLSSLTVSGALNATLSTAAQPNITSVGTLSSLTVSGALNATLSTAAQPNITSVGTLTSLTVSGNVTAGNVIATAFYGNVIGTTGTFSGNVTANYVTANVVLPAGTTTTLPLKFNSGSLLTTAVAGGVNYDGKLFYATTQGQERGMVPAQQIYVLNADYSNARADANQYSVFGVGASLSANTRYYFSLPIAVTRTSGGGATMSLAFGGTATFARITFNVISVCSVTNPPFVNTFTLTSGFTTGTTITGNGNNTASYDATIIGYIDVTNAGTWFPTIGWNALPGTVAVLAQSSVILTPLGPTGSNTNIGTWA